MSVAAFGACTQIPLADSPFRRSALTPDAAARELERMDGEPRVEITPESLPEIDLPAADEELLRDRMPEPRLQANIAQQEAVDNLPAAKAGFTMRWGRLVRVPREEIVDVE